MRCEIAVHLRVSCSETVRELLRKNHFAIYLKNLQTEKISALKHKPVSQLSDNLYEIVALYNGPKCLEDMGISQKSLQRNLACKKIECVTFEN